MTSFARAAPRGIDLARASEIVDRALAIARQSSLRPMTICVLDAGGDLVVYKREDGTGILRRDIVIAKATAALVMSRSSRAIGEMAAKDPLFIQAFMAATRGQTVPTPGGVLIKTTEGVILGAAGSSGDVPDADERCAVLAIRDAGLVPDPAEPVDC